MIDLFFFSIFSLPFNSCFFFPFLLFFPSIFLFFLFPQQEHDLFFCEDDIHTDEIIFRCILSLKLYTKMSHVVQGPCPSMAFYLSLHDSSPSQSLPSVIDDTSILLLATQSTGHESSIYDPSKSNAEVQTRLVIETNEK